jgi:putative Holliday junction resolvase
MEKILGLDFGTERVGAAVSFGTLAEPLTVLPNDGQLLSKIKLLCAANQIDRIVLGRSENVMAEKTEAFAQELGQVIGQPIVFEDETLSSKEVERLLREARLGKRQHRGPIDHLAAALILQRYLDENVASV